MRLGWHIVGWACNSDQSRVGADAAVSFLVEWLMMQLLFMDG
jgi:hypothetical protein